MGAGLPMGAPMSGAVARLGKSGGAAPALPKHRADGLEAWGKARNSHRSSPAKGHPTHPTKGHHPSDSSTPHGTSHSDASTHVSPLRHAGDKAGRNRTLDELGELGGVR